jgi:hypothetical protein
MQDICFGFHLLNIKTIQDIWDENSKQFIDCDLLYSQLIDRKNCISEYSKIKKCIPKDYLKFLKYLFWFPPFVHIVKILSMLGLIFDRTRDTCLNLRMKHLSICK